MSLQVFRVLNKLNPFKIHSGNSIALSFDCRFSNETAPLNLTLTYTINGNGVTFDNGQTSRTRSFNIASPNTNPIQTVNDSIQLKRTDNGQNRISIRITGSIPSGSQIDNINVDVLPALHAVLPDTLVAKLMANMRNEIRKAIKEAVKPAAKKKAAKPKAAKKSKTVKKKNK